MKIYKKGIVVATILSTFSLMAAESKVIQVTTLDDEDGTNSNQCSLREAIRTAYDNKSYGGCNVGNKLNGQKDYIQLKEGIYKLDKGELTPRSHVILYGELPYDQNEKDELTGEYPKQTALKTIIDANFNSRLFNTSQTKANLEINNIELRNGKVASTTPQQANGGAFFIGGSLSLYNSAILNSEAGNKGGAIYFAGSDQNVSASIYKTRIQLNRAKHGSVWDMECKNSLLPVTSPVSINQSSVVENGSENSSSIINICGSSSIDISTSTIARNIADPTNGVIIRHFNDANHTLEVGNTLTLSSNTIVENNAAVTYWYDYLGTKILSSNVLAFNTGKNCKYTPKQNITTFEESNEGETPAEDKIALVTLNNAFAADCDIPASSNTETSKNKILAANANMQDYLSNYYPASALNLHLPLYYPKGELVNAGHQACSAVDQRGFERLTVSKLVLDPNSENTCDIGAVELMKLTASDITALKNTPYRSLIEYYEQNITELKTMQDDPANKSSLLQIQAELKDFEALLAKTKQHNKYRAIYIDPFALALPKEEEASNGELRLKALNTENYKIEVSAKGVGTLKNEGENPYDTELDPLQRCEWIPELKRIMFYRTDGSLTEVGKTELCEYKITELNGGTTPKTSAGVLSASFVNIAPVAKNDTYTIRPESNLSVTVNPLENDYDDDGVDTTTADGIVRPKYYKNRDGSETPIRIESISSGLTMNAERKGLCPDTHLRETCYGGNITFTAKNNLSQFDYQATYNYFDADGGMSNTATILLKNSAKNTNASSSGGGAFGIWGLLGLVALGAYRQRRI